MKYFTYLKNRSKDFVFTAILAIYASACIFSSVYWAVNFNVRNLAMSVGFVLLVPLAHVLEYWLKIKFSAISALCVCAVAFGSILGSCFDLYVTVPFFDDILHTLSGFAFACLGFSLAIKFFGEAKDNKGFFARILFGAIFSLAIALLWELFEYYSSLIFGFDMMEDCIINDISSYYLSGGHNQAVVINDITKTVIYYGENQTYVINGYLDVGLTDTLSDMSVCFLGTVLFCALTVFFNRFAPKVNKIICPEVLTEISIEEAKEDSE